MQNTYKNAFHMNFIYLRSSGNCALLNFDRYILLSLAFVIICSLYDSFYMYILTRTKKVSYIGFYREHIAYRLKWVLWVGPIPKKIYALSSIPPQHIHAIPTYIYLFRPRFIVWEDTVCCVPGEMQKSMHNGTTTSFHSSYSHEKSAKIAHEQKCQQTVQVE